MDQHLGNNKLLFICPKTNVRDHNQAPMTTLADKQMTKPDSNNTDTIIINIS